MRQHKTTDMLGQFTCYWKERDLADLRDKGLTPGYGCGWNDAKTISFFTGQGALNNNHFDFWIDFYGQDGGLTRRDLGGNGLFDVTYEQAYNFAKRPNLGGVNRNRVINPEADNYVRVGCIDCFWDL